MDDKLGDARIPQPFKTFEVDRVLTTVSGGLAGNVREHIVEAVDIALRDYLGSAINLNSLGELGTPQVMIRVRTFQAILDEFRRLLNGHYPLLLTHIGLNMGFNFGISLMRILRNAELIPLDFVSLLHFWARFDSSAQIGRVSMDYVLTNAGEAAVDAKIKQLFLTLGYGDDEPLRHVNLMIGYLIGTVDAASLLWTRWIRASVYETPPYSWRATGCVYGGPERDGAISFTISLLEERLPRVRDGLASAIEACEAGNLVQALILARICLEDSIRWIGRLSADTRFSFGRLLEQLEHVRADMDSERWKLAYAACSEAAHQANPKNELSVLDDLFSVWECVREAETMELSDDQAANLLGAQTKYVTP
jgi:hypothetical protein